MFRILGRFGVLAAGGQELAVGGMQQRAVLVLLLIRSPEVVSRDRLVDELWGDQPPATAEHAVQVYVSGLRKALAGADGVALQSSGQGYRLEIAAERVDAFKFERLVGEAQRDIAQSASEARALLDEALALWQGPPLAELSQFEFARREAERLEELRALAIEGWAEASLACGEPEAVIPKMRDLVGTEPLRERPRRLLMLALYRAGRHAEALVAYREAAETLDEIGLQPGPELRSLEQAILRHDPSLTTPTAAEAGDTASPALTPPSGGSVTAARTSGDVARDWPPQVASASVRRKVVTVLICDLSWSAPRSGDLDPEALHAVTARYRSELPEVLARHGGTIDSFIGTTAMAVFGVPKAREDDALRGARAAAEIGERLSAMATEIGVRLSFRAAVSTGLMLVGEGETLGAGDPVNVAAQLVQAAPPGQILLSEETFRLVRDAVLADPFELLMIDGRSMPVAALRLLSVDRTAPGVKRRVEAPLVGRARELGVLHAAWQRTLGESRCHLFTLLGEAGVGKSRLVSELVSGLGQEATVLSGRCLPYGEGITFWPLAEALGAVGERAEEVLELLGDGGAATPEELFFEVRRLLESLARERPVIAHVDDLQWAEAMLLDLLDHVADLSRGAPILLVCTTRPELLEVRSAWGGGKLNATSLLLEPLPAADCELLLDHLDYGLVPDARAQVISASDGNPLFLEEMAALTRESGTVSVPPTIEALLAARLDRLPPTERELLERAAIEGEVFHRGAVAGLAGDAPVGELEAALSGLVRKELIRPHLAALGGDEAFRFRHLLIRDAAYDGLPKAERAALHQRFADWLERNARELSELDEIVGWHLEQAIRYLTELGGPVDPVLPSRAAEHLHAAGRRAAQRGDGNAARTHLERARRLIPTGDTKRLRIAVDLAEQLVEGDELTRVNTLLSATEENEETALAAQLIRIQWAFFAGSEADKRTAEAKLPGLIAELSRTGDELLLAKAHLAAVQMNWLAGRIAAANQQAYLAAEHARRAGDHGLRARALGWVAGGLIVGPQHATAMAQELDALESEQLGPYVEAFTRHARGELARLTEDFSRARDLHRQAIQRFQDLGSPVMAAACYHQLAVVEIQAGEPSAALVALRDSDAICAEIGERGFRSTTQALLAVSHATLGDNAAAQKALERSDELGDPHDTLNRAVTHAVRAHLALVNGDSMAAERWARSAADSAARMDELVVRGHAELQLARVLHLLEQPDEAALHAHAALNSFEAKGDQPSAHQAEMLLSELSGQPQRS